MPRKVIKQQQKQLSKEVKNTNANANETDIKETKQTKQRKEIKEIKESKESKQEALNQLKKLVNKLSISKENNKKELNVRNVSFSQIYTIVDNNDDTSLNNNSHHFKRTVEKVSLLRHNRPGTPHPKTKRYNNINCNINDSNDNNSNDNKTPNKLYYTNLLENEETPKDYNKLKCALTPHVTNPHVTNNDQSIIDDVSPNDVSNDDVPTVASVVSDLNGVLKATQRIRNTMS